MVWRRRHRRRRRHGRESSIWAGVGAAVLVAVSLAMLGGFGYMRITMRPIALDAELCPVEAVESPGHTIILVDQSDPLTLDVRERLESLVLETGHELPVWHRLTLLGLDGETGNRPIEHFSLCKPPATGNFIYENPETIAARFEEEFRGPLDRALASMIDGDERDWSPIAEGVRRVSLRPDFTSSPGERRIIIVSDMLQHTRETSFLREGGHTANFDRFIAQNPYFRLPRLDGVIVEVRWIENPIPTRADDQTREVERFWNEFFFNSGAHVVYGPPL